MNENRARDAWLNLATTPGIGAVLGHRLVDRFGSPGQVFAATRDDLAAAGVPARTQLALQSPDNEAIARARNWLDVGDHHFLTHAQPEFPRALDNLENAPPWLYARGDLELLGRPGIAIVGSRNPTANGRELAREFAGELASAGLVVVSGLARGIDAAAHAGALAAGGMTIAVCGTGLDRIYPAANKELAKRIADDGLLVSEFGLGTPPARGNFPRRNRIIAGLTHATLVVEAARESGSLITARLAAEAGREVFAIPGSIHNPLARGCHRLIRDGAALIESVDQIFEALAPKLHTPLARAPATTNGPSEPNGANAGDDKAIELISAMGHAPARIDELAARTGWNAEDIASTLLILELEGRVVALPGGAYAPA